jgi:DNA-binding NarL/FixJ family response regulator
MHAKSEKQARGGEEMQRLLLVEDHASFRQTLALVFDQEPDFEVVAQAGTVAEARLVMVDREADLAVVDLSLPDGEGVELIEDLRETNPHFAALVLTASLDRAEHARAVEAGAAGVLHKAAEVDEILDSTRRLAAGETLLSSEELVELLRLAGQSREEEREAQASIEQLTRREREVLFALSEGLSNKQIAERLHMSVDTERTHRTRHVYRLPFPSPLHLDDAAVEHHAHRAPHEAASHRSHRRRARARTRGERLPGAALPDPHPDLVLSPDVHELHVRLLGEEGIALDRRTDLFQVQRLDLSLTTEERDSVGVAHRDPQETEATELYLGAEPGCAHVHAGRTVA